MMYMIMGGLVLIGIGFTILIMNRFQQTESVYFREYGKRAKGRIVLTQKEAEEEHFGAGNVKSYEIRVSYEAEDGKPGAAGSSTDWISMNGISKNAAERIASGDIVIDEAENDNEIEAIGIYSGEQISDIEHVPGAEIEFFYDTNNPEKVIFYDPEAKAAKTTARNKIALLVMIAGAALFVIGRVMA